MVGAAEGVVRCSQQQPGTDGESDTVKAAWKLRAMAFRDLVIYFRNNPSILIWEGGNPAGGVKPVAHAFTDMFALNGTLKVPLPKGLSA